MVVRRLVTEGLRRPGVHAHDIVSVRGLKGCRPDRERRLGIGRCKDSQRLCVFGVLRRGQWAAVQRSKGSASMKDRDTAGVLFRDRLVGGPFLGFAAAAVSIAGRGRGSCWCRRREGVYAAASLPCLDDCLLLLFQLEGVTDLVHDLCLWTCSSC